MNKNLRKLSAVLAIFLIATSCTDDANESLELDNADFTVQQETTTILTDEVGSAEAIPGQYIVVYNTDFGRSQSLEVSNESVINLTYDILGTSRSSSALNIKQVYSKSINGVALELTMDQIAILNSD